jgi:hypothetical protein
MNLGNYIKDLLFRYDCVIVPGFGGFVTNRIGAKLNSVSHTFDAPTKQIAFNSHLTHNDGLLANYIASTKQISFEKAAMVISKAVQEWQKELQNTDIKIDSLGTISLNESQQIIFEPSETINLLTASFGLSSVAAPSIKRYASQIKPFLPSSEDTYKKGVPTFIKYAATAAILLTLGFTGYHNHQQNQQKEVFTTQQKELEKKIQSATFVMSNPLPTLELNVVKEVSKPFHVVAGAFQFTANADKKVKALISQGFNAKIIGINKWGLTQVTFHSYANKNDAINSLNKIKRTVAKDAWLLVKNIK